jgi:hypothetical protein
LLWKWRHRLSVVDFLIFFLQNWVFNNCFSIPTKSKLCYQEAHFFEKFRRRDPNAFSQLFVGKSY